MAGERVERRLAAVMAAGVVGYSRIIDPSIAAHRGRIVKTTGNGLLVEFASAIDAVMLPAALGGTGRRSRPLSGIDTLTTMPHGKDTEN